MSALDIVGKGYLPIGDSGFNLYALGGIARASNTTQFKNNGVSLANGVTAPREGTSTHYKIRPIYGIGAGYDFAQTNFGTRVQFSHLQGSGHLESNPKAIPSANMLTLNVSYNFG